MKLRRILFALLPGALAAAVGFVTLELRNYLTSRSGLSISPKLYAVLAILFIWTVASLSMQRLIRELRADAEVARPQIPAHQFEAGENRIETVHRYPWLLRYPAAALGLIYVALPYQLGERGRSIADVTYAGSFGIAFVMFAIAIYLFIYSVTVKHDRIVVNEFGHWEIRFSDVADTKLVRTARGRQIVLRLKNGQVFRFGGKLTGFLTLLDALTARAPTPSTPTTK
jgi:hypothetical protein